MSSTEYKTNNAVLRIIKTKRIFIQYERETAELCGTKNDGKYFGEYPTHTIETMWQRKRNLFNFPKGMTEEVCGDIIKRNILQLRKRECCGEAQNGME